jgi:hypothetical protein
LFLSGKINKKTSKYYNEGLGLSKGEKKNYLKGYFLLAKKFCKKYNITKMQLEILFYFYQESFFDIGFLKNLGFGERARRFHLYQLRDSNLVITIKHHSPQNKETKKWALTRKGKMLVKRFYRILENIEDINSEYEELY